MFSPLVSQTSSFPFYLYCFIFLKHLIVHVTLLFQSGSPSSGFSQFHQPYHLHFFYLTFPWLIHVFSHCLAISSTVHPSFYLLNLGQSLVHTFKPTSGLTPSRKPCPSGLAGSVFLCFYWFAYFPSFLYAPTLQLKISSLRTVVSCA